MVAAAVGFQLGKCDKVLSICSLHLSRPSSFLCDLFPFFHSSLSHITLTSSQTSIYIFHLASPNFSHLSREPPGHFLLCIPSPHTQFFVTPYPHPCRFPIPVNPQFLYIPYFAQQYINPLPYHSRPFNTHHNPSTRPCLVPC